jgi:molybdopterin synthase sulfur carrier subunit
MQSVTIKIPSMLTRLSKGQRSVAATGNTVREAITDLERQYPGFQAQLYTHEGELHTYVNIFVGSENSRFLNGLDTKVEGGNTIQILPAIAGGCVL